MKRLALLFFSVSSATLAACGFAAGLLPLGGCGVFVGVVGGVLVLFEAEARGLSLLLLLITLLAVANALLDANPHLVVFAASSALIGWEFGLTAVQAGPFSKQDVARFARKKLVSLGAIGISSLVLAIVAFQTRYRLSFGLALGLGFAALVLLGLAFHTAARKPQRKSQPHD